MFAKIFAQIFDSSIAADFTVRHMFMDLIVLADRDGVVDMTADAIARRTNVPLETVLSAINRLSSPDPSSRSKEEDGRRLMLIDSRRDWGWQIVNYEHYRQLRDDEARRAYFRDAKRKLRSQRKEKQRVRPASSNPEPATPPAMLATDDLAARPVRSRGYVYYAQGEIGVKIGYSSNPWSRVEEMLGYDPTVKLVATEPGDAKLERQRHKQFSADRVDREWFRISPALEKHIARLATVLECPQKSTKAEAEAEAEAEAIKAKTKTTTTPKASPSSLAGQDGEQKSKPKPKRFVLPEWIGSETWADFEESRHKLRKPMTDRAKRDIVTKLQSLRSKGNDVELVIAQSIRKGWQDVFAVKDEMYAAAAKPDLLAKMNFANVRKQ